MADDRLRKTIEVIIGKGKVYFIPSRGLINSIIDELIREGRIPPREKWKDLKESEAPPGES